MSSHPGSAILGWWEQAPKDEEGYANLVELVDVLNVHTEVRGPTFLRNTTKPEWKNRFGFSVKFHDWKPNKIRIERSEKLG
jgi:hypothetical protein